MSDDANDSDTTEINSDIADDGSLYNDRVDMEAHSQHGDTTSEEENVEDEIPMDTDQRDESREEAQQDEEDADDDESALKCYLMGIELYNFKSFFGPKNLVGPFTEFSAIIGPNGSGKSNLMDAISFALCIKQNDKIRVNKLVDLVNKHSIKSPRSSSSEFDPRWKAFVKLIFYTKGTNPRVINLTRIIYQDGSSKFMIDEFMKTRDEYMKILSRMGIDAKYKIFLLFQGTVDSLITKNPKEFTRYLEEICGSIQFVKQYNFLKDKISEKERELKLINDEKRDLASKKRVLDRIFSERDKHRHISKQIEQSKIKVALFKLHDIVEKMRQINHRINDENRTVENTINGEIVSQKQIKDELEQDFITFNKQLTKITQEYRAADLDITRNKHKIDGPKEKVEHLKKQRDNAQKNKEATIKKLKDNKEKIANLKTQIEKLQDEIEEQRNVPPQWIDQYNGLKTTFEDKLQTEGLYDIYRNNKPFESELNALKKKLTLTEEMKISYEKEIFDKEKLQKLAAMIETHQAEYNKVKEEIKLRKAEIQQQESKLAEVRLEINRLKGIIRKNCEKTKMNKKEGEERQFLNKLKNAYPGRVYGRVANLFKVSNAKYRKAATVILKKHSRAIVVDSMATVQQIAKNEGKFLNYFSQSFIMLDRIHTDRDQRQLQNILLTVGGEAQSEICALATAIDLSDSSKPELKSVISHVFGNVVWCPNEDSACRVAYELGDGKRHDAISRDGTFYRANGNISANFDDNELTNDDLNRFENLYEELGKFEEQFQQESENLLNARLDLGPKEAEGMRLRAQLNILLKQKEDLENEKTDEAEIQKKIKEFDDIIQRQQAAIVEIQNDMAKNERIEAIKAKVFGDFFKNFEDQNIQTMEDFEAASQPHLLHAKVLNDREKELDGLKEELKALELSNWAETSHNWDAEIETIDRNLAEAEVSRKKAFERYNKDSHNFEELAKKFENIKLEEGRKKAELNKAISKLEALYTQKKEMLSSIISLSVELDKCRKARHEIFKNAFMESLPLPLRNRESFSQHYDNQLSVRGALENEDEIELNFKSIADDLKKDEKERERIRYHLEEEIVAKQNELPALTITDPEQKKTLEKNSTALTKNISANRKKVAKAHEALIQAKTEFDSIKKARYSLFSPFFNKITANLNLFYQRLTKSAASQAFLIADNPEEPYLGGIQYSCIVPGKMFQPISALSGGEKCLAAFAFIYSCYSDRFPCFFILDEIDGSLDNDNIAKLVDFIKLRKSESQFILISHKPEVFGRADSLIGVCREVDEVSSLTESKTYSLDLRVYPD